MRVGRSFAAIGVGIFALLVAGCGGASGGGVIPQTSSAAASSDGDLTSRLDRRQWSRDFEACASFSNVSGFNGTPISAGNGIWFSSVMHVNGADRGAIVYITNSRITYKINGTLQTLNTPNAGIIIDPLFRVPRVFFDNGLNAWIEAVSPNAAGNAFADGAALALKQTLPGGVTPVTWTATFITNNPNVSLNWQWSAAAYTHLPGDYNGLNVKPLDDAHYPPFNADAAGTPENFKKFLTAGATGNGGTNYAGTLSTQVGVAPCGGASPSPSPTPPAYTALVADNGQLNGQANLWQLQSSQVNSTAVSGGFQLDSLVYASGSNFGLIANGGSANLFPFNVSGNTVSLTGSPIDISPYGKYAAAAVMPDPSTAFVALNTTGVNDLLEISNANSVPAFNLIPIGGTFAEDTDSIAMSNDGTVLLTRGAHVTVYNLSGAPPYTVTEIGQFGEAQGIDGPDHAALRGREGMAVSPVTYSGDYRALIAGTANPGSSSSVGTVWLFGGLKSLSGPVGLTSTAIDPSHHSYAAETDGKTAFVGTDVGIAVVPGVDTASFAPHTTTIVSPIAGTTGSNLVQISSLAVTPDGKWLVAMGLPQGATAPGGQGFIDVLPIMYGTNGVTLGAAIQSLPITVPNNDQLVLY